MSFGIPIFEGSSGTLALPGGPVTTTGSYTLSSTDLCVIFNGAATATATLPGAATNTGRMLILKTIAAQAVNSSLANIQAQGSAANTTAILAATTGKWAFLQAVGTTYIVMMSN